MAVSLTFIGVLVMIDVLVLVNFLVVKWIRNWTDKREEHIEADKPSAALLPNINTSGLKNVFNWVSSPPKRIIVYTQALFMDVVHRETNSVQKFEKWRDLPYAYGKMSTIVLVFLSLTLLSSDFLANDMMFASLQKGSAKKKYCRAVKSNETLNDFESMINSKANLNLSRKQLSWTVGFNEALVADTELYGTDGFECPSINDLSGSKNDWSSTNTSFFPGYCSSAKQAEIAFAKQVSCQRRECECVKFLYTSWRMCWLAKVCVDVEVSCPESIAMQEAEFDEYNSEHEMLVQAEEENQASSGTLLPTLSSKITTAATYTLQKILHQVDVASKLYAIYSLIALFFPAPLLMFRLPFVYYLRRAFFGVHKSTFILFVVALWWGIEYFYPIWVNPEIQLYLKMLRLGDPCLFDRDLVKQKFAVLKNMCDELVSMESEFMTNTLAINRVGAEVDFFVNSCNCTFPNQNLVYYQTPTYIYHSDAVELGFAREIDGLCEQPYCNRIFFPVKDSSFVGDTSMCYSNTLAKKYIFSAPGDGVRTSWWQIWISTGILSQILVDFAVTNFCIAIYRLADPLSSCGGRFEWPAEYLFRGRTGDVETDKEVSNTTGMPSDMAMELRARKTRSLQIISTKWVIIWGIVTHLCLINLSLAPIEDESVSMLGSTDGLALSLCLAVAVASMFLLMFLRYCLERRGVHNQVKKEDDTQTQVSLDSDQSANSSPLLGESSSSDSSKDDSISERYKCREII